MMTAIIEQGIDFNPSQFVEIMISIKVQFCIKLSTICSTIEVEMQLSDEL